MSLDWTADLLDLQALLLVLILLTGVRAFNKTVKSSPIEHWHFYATKTKEGKDWGDVTKLGIIVGIFASTLMVAYMFWSHKNTPYNWQMVAIFAIWMMAIYGVEMFAKWARVIATKLAEKKLGEGKPPETPTEPKA